MTGFLSPQAEFIECDIGNHSITAIDIYEQVTGNIFREVAKQIGQDFADAFLSASDWLVNLDYIYFSDMCESDIVFPPILTNEQYFWFGEHINEMTPHQRILVLEKVTGTSSW